MTPEEAKKLLGGYATGSLTAEERKALFSAALEDQTLFDALAEEEALRETLDDESYRSELVSALGEEKATLGARLLAWWWRPQSLAYAGGLAAVVLAAVVVYQIGQAPAEVEIAMVAKQEVAEAPALPPPPAVIPLQPEAVAIETPVPAPEPEPKTATFVSRSDDAAGRAEEQRAEMAMADAAREMAVGDVAEAMRAPEPEAMAFSAMPIEPPGQYVTESAPREMRATSSAEAPARARQVAQLTATTEADTSATYTVERADSDGDWTAVPVGTVVGLSDEIRLAIIAQQDGTLIVADVTSGRPLWSGAVEQGNSYYVPLPAPESPGTRRMALRYGETGVAAGGGGGAAGFRLGAVAEPQPDTVVTLEYESQ